MATDIEDLSSDVHIYLLTAYRVQVVLRERTGDRGQSLGLRVERVVT